MKRIVTILCVLCMIFTILPVSAETTETMMVSYNSETSEVKVSGQSSQKTVMFVIVKGDTPLSSLTDSNPPICFMPFAVTDGKYEDVLGMPSDASSGKYTAYISASDGNHLSDSFVFINIPAAEKVLTEISNNPADFTKIVDENAATLGMDTEDEFWKNNKSEILELLSVIKTEYSSPSQLYNDLYKAYALIYSGGKGKNDILQTFKKYEPQLGIDYSEFFEEDTRISEKALETLCTLIANENFNLSLKTLSLEKILNNLKVLASVKAAEDAVMLRKVIEDDFKDVFSGMISADKNYAKIPKENIHKVYTKMILNEFSEFEDIERAFKASTKALVSLSPSGSSGSSGSSSGGGSVVTIPSVKEEDAPSYPPNNTTSPSNPEIGGNFSDVSESSWEYEAVSALQKKGVINGYKDGTFKPASNVTRAEFAKIAYQAFSDKLTAATTPAQPGKADITFSDISNQWYASYVNAAASAGIIKGSDGKFSPDAYIKREDAAVIIYNIFKLSNITSVSAPTYIDSSDISPYAYTPVGSLFKLKVMIGANDTFRPAATITRAESAQLIYNALNYLNSQN